MTGSARGRFRNWKVPQGEGSEVEGSAKEGSACLRFRNWKFRQEGSAGGRFPRSGMARAVNLGDGRRSIASNIATHVH